MGRGRWGIGEEEGQRLREEGGGGGGAEGAWKISHQDGEGSLQHSP